MLNHIQCVLLLILKKTINKLLKIISRNNYVKAIQIKNLSCVTSFMEEALLELLLSELVIKRSSHGFYQYRNKKMIIIL